MLFDGTRAGAGLCAHKSLSPGPEVQLLGGSGCVGAAALPVLLCPPSLCLPMPAARCAVSAVPPSSSSSLLPALDSSLPSRLSSTRPALALAAGRREVFLSAHLLSLAWCRLSPSPRRGWKGIVYFSFAPLQNFLLNTRAGNKR